LNRTSGSSVFIPFADSLGIGRDQSRPFTHGLSVGQLGELLAIVVEVAHVPLVTGRIAQIYADHPALGAVGLYALLGKAPVVQSMGK